MGSSSLITNLDGEIVHHIEYVPFGEVFIEERNNKWNTPFLFNAKELDEETGLYYYGARYYDPRTSVWISTDPLQEKYPNISSYAYCVLNPVKIVDPDGKDPIVIGFTGGFTKTQARDSSGDTDDTTTKIIGSVVDNAKEAGIIVKGAVYQSSLYTVNGAVDLAMAFIETNHTEGDNIVIYGYSYGGDAAVELVHKLNEKGYTVNLLVTVDAADGPALGGTVNRDISENVITNINEYQTRNSSIGSRGYDNTAKNSEKTNVYNLNVTKLNPYGRYVTHANIDETMEDVNVSAMSKSFTGKSTGGQIKIQNGDSLTKRIIGKIWGLFE